MTEIKNSERYRQTKNEERDYRGTFCGNALQPVTCGALVRGRIQKTRQEFELWAMGYDCVGDMECAKPYPLPKHTDPLNGDPQASK